MKKVKPFCISTFKPIPIHEKESLFFFSYATLFFLCCIVASCEKEYSLENGYVPTPGTDTIPTPGLSVFTYSDSSGNCANATINGIYKAGVASTESNTVTLKVSVSTAGTYQVSTETVNGIIFSGTGTFTKTGVQSLVLFAGGTPATVGNFTYGPKPVGCFFSITFSDTDSNTNHSAVFTFPSAPNECDQVKVNGVYIAGDSLNVTDSIVGIQVNVTVPGTYYLSTVPNNGITFSGSGTFTSTGLQTVNLYGSGLPVTPGQFSYSPGNNGCFFTVTVSPANSVATNFIKCKINGLSYAFTDAVFTETLLAANPPAPAISSLDISGTINGNNTENILLSLNKVGNAISAGETFDASGVLSGKLYIISYSDAGGTMWNAVSADSFTPFIVNITSKTTSRVQGIFSGTLNDTGGNIRTITEGTFSVPVQ